MTPTPEPVDDGNCTANEREIIRLCEQVMILSESLENCHKLVKFNSTTEWDKVLETIERYLVHECYFLPYGNDGETVVRYFPLKSFIKELRTPTPEAHR